MPSDAIAVETASKKESRKQKILELLTREKEKSLALRALPLRKGELSNSEIREALGVSSRSVVRYMDELEAEGKVEQVGTIGHAVTYRAK